MGAATMRVVFLLLVLVVLLLAEAKKKPNCRRKPGICNMGQYCKKSGKKGGACQKCEKTKCARGGCLPDEDHCGKLKCCQEGGHWRCRECCWYRDDCPMFQKCVEGTCQPMGQQQAGNIH